VCQDRHDGADKETDKDIKSQLKSEPIWKTRIYIRRARERERGKGGRERGRGEKGREREGEGGRGTGRRRG